MKVIIMAKKWSEVRQAAVDSGRLDEAKVAGHRERQLAEVQAYRLADMRKAMHLTQTEVAEAMEVTQSRISQLEKGLTEAVELATIRKYVEALGGHLRVVADFGAAGSLPVDLVAQVGEKVVHVQVKETESRKAPVKQAPAAKAPAKRSPSKKGPSPSEYALAR